MSLAAPSIWGIGEPFLLLSASATGQISFEQLHFEHLHQLFQLPVFVSKSFFLNVSAVKVQEIEHVLVLVDVVDEPVPALHEG